MKKSIVILLLVIQILLLILFQNLYYLFKGFEETDISQLTNESKLMRNLKSMKTIFNGLSILLGLLIIASGIYLVVVYRRTKHEDKIKDLPPLHNYLLELRDSERELKDIVEKQQVDVIEKEELNKSIINNINSAIIFLNNKERIDIFNSVAEALFDQSYANAKNNSINKIMIKFQEVIGFIEKNKDKKISSEIESNEKIFFVDLNPIDKIGRLIIIKDITEEKKRELINRRNKNFIMLGEMTTFLTHEIRNSLGVIYGYTKTLKSEEEKVSKVNQEINFLTTMMERFLNFSKSITVKKKEKIDLVDLLNSISIEKKMEIDSNEKTMEIENDQTLLTSVFSNMILNSKEAGANQIKINFKKKKHLEIIFSDNGKGINNKITEKIWFPFFTTKRKGTGMGLAIVRKIITTLNGEISLLKSDESGTTFRIIFYS